MTIRSYNTNGITPPRITQDNVQGANRGDLQIIEDRLGDVVRFLEPWGTTIETVTADAQEYLPLQAAGNKDLFFQAIGWLKHCIQKYLENASDWYLNVARGNVQNALASAVPLAKRDSLDIRTGAQPIPRHTTFIIQPAFEQPFTIAQQRKQLTAHGQATSLLHELTHSVLGTKDVYSTADEVRPYAFLEDGKQPGPGWQETYLPELCRALAQSGAAFQNRTLPRPMPYAWMNAENWTRALMTGLYSANNPEPPEFNLL